MNHSVTQGGKFIEKIFPKTLVIKFIKQEKRAATLHFTLLRLRLVG